MICACDSELFYFEDLAKRQVQIYPDACDFGYKYTNDDIPKVKAALKALKETYVNKTEKWGDKKAGGWETTMFIGFEREGHMWSGVELRVGCHWERKVRFISIVQERKLSQTDGYIKD